MNRASGWLLLVGACSVLPFLHCASKSGESGFDNDAAPAVEAGAETSTFGGGDGAVIIPPDTECAEVNKQIYVLGSDRALYRFDVAPLTFTRIGMVACPSAAGTFSMAIDRHGTAFVEYTDGRVYAVDTANASCKATAFQPGQAGFETFGMGYSLNGDSANGETLYVSGAGLASLDTNTFELGFVGSLTYGRTELTGQGTSLFAFSVGSGVIAGLNKADASTTVVYRTSAVDEQAAFAFAQWGGDFYVFTGSNHSIVTQYSPTTNLSKVVVQDTGMLIVGAGSSTCAPTTPPK